MHLSLSFVGKKLSNKQRKIRLVFYPNRVRRLVGSFLQKLSLLCFYRRWNSVYGLYLRKQSTGTRVK